MDNKNIRYKLENNEKIIFQFDTNHTFRKVEELLVNMGCVWRSGHTILPYSPSNYFIYVNSFGDEPKTLSHGFCDPININYYLTENNIDVFMIENTTFTPNYNSRKIIRTI